MKQQLPCTDMLGGQFIWCLGFTEMVLAERRPVCCTQLKVQHFLPSSSNKEQRATKLLHFRNVHSSVLMNMLHETKIISLASDFKGLRSRVE